jgi:hypothetical protein
LESTRERRKIGERETEKRERKSKEREVSFFCLLNLFHRGKKKPREKGGRNPLTVVLGAEAVERGPENVDKVPLGAQEREERVVVCVEVVACFFLKSFWVRKKG